MKPLLKRKKSEPKIQHRFRRIRQRFTQIPPDQPEETLNADFKKVPADYADSPLIPTIAWGKALYATPLCFFLRSNLSARNKSPNQALSTPKKNLKPPSTHRAFA